jgi:hypothetical protein
VLRFESTCSSIDADDARESLNSIYIATLRRLHRICSSTWYYSDYCTLYSIPVASAQVENSGGHLKPHFKKSRNQCQPCTRMQIESCSRLVRGVFSPWRFHSHQEPQDVSGCSTVLTGF